MLRKSILLFGTQIIFGATLFFNNLMIARILGPTGKGMVALLVFVPTLTVIVVSLGFNLSATYFLSRKEYPVHEVFGTVFFLTVCSSIFIAVGVALLWSLIQGFAYRDLPISMVLVSLASLPTLLLIFYFEGLWVAIDHMTALISVRLCQSSVYFLSGLVLVGLLKQGAFGAILAFTLGTYAASVLILVWVFCILGRLPTFSFGLLKHGLKFGLAAYPGSVADYTMYRADTFMLSYLASFQQLGYYSFAVPMAELIWYLTSSIRPVLFVRTAQAVAEEANAITPLVLRSTLALAVLMGGGIFAGGVVVVHLFLPDFAPALPVLAILLMATVIALIFQLTLADLTSRGWGARSSQIALSILPFGIIFYIVLIPRFGIIGAALGSVLTYLLESLLALIWFWKLTGVNLRQMLLPNQADVALATRLIRHLKQRIL